MVAPSSKSDLLSSQTPMPKALQSPGSRIRLEQAHHRHLLAQCITGIGPDVPDARSLYPTCSAVSSGRRASSDKNLKGPCRHRSLPFSSSPVRKTFIPHADPKTIKKVQSKPPKPTHHRSQANIIKALATSNQPSRISNEKSHNIPKSGYPRSWSGLAEVATSHSACEASRMPGFCVVTSNDFGTVQICRASRACMRRSVNVTTSGVAGR